MVKASRVYIEISGMCKADCPYCAQQRLRQAGNFGGIMSPDLFEQILDHLLKIGVLDRTKTCYIPLFNWGELFLNSEINEILRILKKKGFYTQISSSFIVSPDIDREYLPIISDLTFSLSGFSQDSYGRIHGTSLKETLGNFESFYSELRRYSPITNVCISWHRYLFNENELWDAYRYFKRPRIRFIATVAFFNDILEMMSFLRGDLSETRKNQAKGDLFLDHIREGIAYSKRKSNVYCCPGWDSLVIDEAAQLLLCCGVTRYDSDHVLGNILEMSAREIWNSKSNDHLCNECISSGLALWLYNQNPFNSRPWPSGGGLDRPRVWFLHNLRPKLGRMLRKLPHGEGIINTVEDMRSPWKL